MEGLECAVIPFSALNDEKRYEAEFFRKRFLQEDAALVRLERPLLGSFANVSDGPHGYHVLDDASPIAMLTAKCASNWFADRSDADCIAKWIDDENGRSRLRNRDVILSTRGTVGKCALVVPEALPANLDQDVARISWDDHSELIPEFVVAYLNSRFGQDHMTRYASGMVQQGISLAKVRDIPIPRLGHKLQKAVERCVNDALNTRRQSTKSFWAAEDEVVAAIGLRDWNPPEPLTYTRRAFEAFAAGRLDSQYFAPRVAELLVHLYSDRRTIRDVAPPRYEKFLPSRIGTFRYIEIGDVRSDGTANCEVVLMRESPSRATWYVRAGDVLTSTVRPNRRLSALITPEQDGCVASSGFVVLQPQAVPPEVMLTYLRLPVFCELMDLHTSASLYPAISDSDLLALPFPEIPPSARDTVVTAVRSAHTARKRAQELLEHAKRSVEIAIEESEGAALKYLEKS